jgi:hypothetical protein
MYKTMVSSAVLWKYKNKNTQVWQPSFTLELYYLSIFFQDTKKLTRSTFPHFYEASPQPCQYWRWTALSYSLRSPKSQTAYIFTWLTNLRSDDHPSLRKLFFQVLLHNGGSCNTCTIKWSITLLCIPKQSTWQNGVVPYLLLILNSNFNHFG